MKRLLATTALGCALLSLSATADIGSVSAVNTDMQGTRPSATPRVLGLGDRVIQNERIETSANGSGQLLFIDQTSLSVAPNSDIVLDEYVFDANQDAGRIALSMTRGVLRFVGGRVSKNRDAVVRTPTSTIGIRGGMALIEVDENGHTRVIAIAAEYVTVEGVNGGKVTLSRPNAVARTGADGVPVFVGLASQEDIAPSYAKLEGKGDGGAPANSSRTADTGSVATVNSRVRG